MTLFWSTDEHTASVVPLLAFGPGAESFTRIHRVSEVGSTLMALVQGGSGITVEEDVETD